MLKKIGVWRLALATMLLLLLVPLFLERREFPDGDRAINIAEEHAINWAKERCPNASFYDVKTELQFSSLHHHELDTSFKYQKNANADAEEASGGVAMSVFSSRMIGPFEFNNVDIVGYGVNCRG